MGAVGSAVDFPPLKETLEEREQSEARGDPWRQHYAIHRGDHESPVESPVANSYHEGDEIAQRAEGLAHLEYLELRGVGMVVAVGYLEARGTSVRV